MVYLFVDNFRGFSKTLIPLKDVNFFVGENSTGKSSILSLIYLFNKWSFWYDQDFDTEDVSLGCFEDMVSRNSSNKKYFSIGFIYPKANPNNEHILGFLMTFKQREGMACPARYTISLGSRYITIRFDPKRTLYKFWEATENLANAKSVENIFLNWSRINNLQNASGYHSLRRIKYRGSTNRLHMIPRILAEQNIITEEEWDTVDYSDFVNPIFWFAPIRAKPRRTYDRYKADPSVEGEHTAYSIKKQLLDAHSREKFLKFIRKFGKDSGLFKSVDIVDYGNSLTAPFELEVVLDQIEFNICNVGYGVPQSLPFVVDIFLSDAGSWFAIQQPEIHLHPRAQAALGTLFYEFAAREKKKFLIESHSDYIVDNYRLNYLDSRIKKKPQAQILFFSRIADGKNSVIPIGISDEGKLLNVPPNYRDFFLKQKLRQLEL